MVLDILACRQQSANRTISVIINANLKIVQLLLKASRQLFSGQGKSSLECYEIKTTFLKKFNFCVKLSKIFL